MSDTSIKVFDYNDLPGRRLHVKTTHANPNSMDLGRQMSIMREQMARRLAELILEQPDLFKVHGNGIYIEQWANVVVLTDDELAALAREKFKEGIAHAHGFMRLPSGVGGNGEQTKLPAGIDGGDGGEK